MPSFSDSIVLFILALMLFGPKRLPKLARELGKWIGEFRRASNEFKMQMDDELRLTEQADRQKEIAAMQAAAPVTPPIPETAQPELPTEASATAPEAEPATAPEPSATPPPIPAYEIPAYEIPAYEMVDGIRTPIPIATAGELSIMPPSTGLPTPRSSALGGMLDSIPETEPTETAAHGN
jgi:sec-independent protein translocase protein TatB